MDGFKQLVDETSNIKNELVRCHADLKTKLKAKDVDVLETDKMADLINKVNTIEQGYKVSLVPTRDMYFSYWEGSRDIEVETTLYDFSSTIPGSVLIEFFSYGGHFVYIYENENLIDSQLMKGNATVFKEIAIIKGKKYRITVAGTSSNPRFTLKKYAIVGGISVNGQNIIIAKPRKNEV